MKVLLLTLFVAAVTAAPLAEDDVGESVQMIVNGVPEGEPLEIGDIVDIKLHEHVDGEVVTATNLLHPYTAVGIAEAEVAAVPDVVLPGPVVMPAPALPEVIAPAPVVLPSPALPEVSAPAPVVLPSPAVPEVNAPAPVVLPSPSVPEVNAPAPVVLPSPAAPEVYAPAAVELPSPAVPEIIGPAPVVLPSPAVPEVSAPAPVVLPSPAVPEIIAPAPVVMPSPAVPEVIAPAPIVLPSPAVPEIVIPDVAEELPVPAPQFSDGELYNDGLVQVQYNGPEESSVITTLQSWFNLILNYFRNDIEITQQII